jgi:hypothetical protein
LAGAVLGAVAVGCEGVGGAVGLWEQAPDNEATDSSMTIRKARDIMGSIWVERHRYDCHEAPTDIGGDSIICGGAH